MRSRAALIHIAFLLALSLVAPANASPVVFVYPPTAVIAVIDTGINPYHIVFRDDSPRARQHPSTYIDGFPKGAKPLRLSLNEKDFWTAVHKDCDVWNSVKTGELYWFPGTKIVGGITFDSSTPHFEADRTVREELHRIYRG